MQLAEIQFVLTQSQERVDAQQAVVTDLQYQFDEGQKTIVVNFGDASMNMPMDVFLASAKSKLTEYQTWHKDLSELNTSLVNQLNSFVASAGDFHV